VNYEVCCELVIVMSKVTSIKIVQFIWMILVSVEFFLITHCTVFSHCTHCLCCCICAEDALEGVSLDKFLARHTSEDNISFSEIMADAEKKRRLKHAWLYEKVDEQLEVSVLYQQRHCHHDRHHYYSLKLVDRHK